MRRPPVLLTLLALLLAGCTQGEPTETAAAVEPAPDAEPAPMATPPPSSPVDATPAAPAPEDARADGPGVATLALGGNLSLRATCRAACAPTPFSVEPGNPGLLEVRAAWDGTRTRGLALEVVGPDGLVHAGARGFDGARVLLPDAPPGAYLATLTGDGDVSLRVGLRAPGAPRGDGVDLLPNLVTLVPTQVGIARCDPWETVEQEAKACLRLGNAVGNAGDGPLEVALDPAQGATTLAGEGRFVQRVFQAKGEPREVPVGAAAFHPTHAHYHYDGLARFSLHPVDPDTGIRGEAVATHHKAGFCLLDIGEMEEPDVEPEARRERRAEQECLVPGSAKGWTMGVSRGFYDLYTSGLTDQYVEVSGVPDGMYELVSTCNWSGSLVELDAADNSASVLLRLSGGKATVLEERGFYRVPE